MSRKKQKSYFKAAPLPEQLQPRCLNIQQAATYLGVAVYFLRTQVWDGAIPHARLGHRIIFDRADLDRFLDRQKAAK
jgi:excisionase family DNA binding protein